MLEEAVGIAILPAAAEEEVAAEAPAATADVTMGR